MASSALHARPHDVDPSGLTKVNPRRKFDGEPEGFPEWIGVPGNDRRYRGQYRLGGGGQAVVYRYRDTQLGRIVAVKRLSIEAVRNDRWRGRLEREQLSLGRLLHPNIAMIYDALNYAGATFLILEFVDGETLRERLVRGVLTPAEALSLAVQLARAIEAMHARSLVHRDIKPDNLMITPDGWLKVLDLGIVKDLEDVPLTDEHQVVGAAPYMSPEQSSAPGQLGRPSDVWSFGCVLYECLTGTKAFPHGFVSTYAEPVWARIEYPSIEAFLRRCLDPNPAGRPTRLVEECEKLLAELRGISPERPTAVPIPSAIPASAFHIVGRATEITDLARLVGRCKHLSLVGTAGVGKSRLAWELAAALYKSACESMHPTEGSDGVWVVRLGAGGPSATVAERVAATVLGPARGTERDAHAALIDRLEDCRAVIVLDDCDGQRKECVNLANALVSCAHLRIVTTARQATGIEGEQRHLVRGLPYPKDIADDDIERFDAVRLFVERAQRVRAAFVIGPKNVRAVGEICRRLKGNPGAIILTAARVVALSVNDVAARLFDVFDPRHVFRSTVTSSFEALAEEAAGAPALDLLMRLPIFHGGFTLEACEKICGDDERSLGGELVVNLLAQLVERSLVEDDLEAGRYELLETIHECLRASPRARPIPAEVRVLHFEHFRDLAIKTGDELDSPDERAIDQAHRLRLLEQEHGNLLNVLAVAKAKENPLDQMTVARALHRFWYVHGHLTLGRKEIEEALARTPAEHELRPRLLNALGMLAEAMGDTHTARRSYEQARDLFRQSGKARYLAGTLTNLGKIAQDDGDLIAARRYHEESLAAYESLGDRTGMAWVQLNLGWLALCCESHDEAARLAEAGLPEFCRTGDRVREGAARHILGIVAYHQRAPREAIAYLDDAMRIRAQLGDKRFLGWTLAWLVIVLESVGRYAEAVRLGAVVETLTRATGASLPASDLAAYERALGEARRNLGDSRSTDIWRTGRWLTIDDLLTGLDPFDEGA